MWTSALQRVYFFSFFILNKREIKYGEIFTGRWYFRGSRAGQLVKNCNIHDVFLTSTRLIGLKGCIGDRLRDFVTVFMTIIL